MGIVGGPIGYRLLRSISSDGKTSYMERLVAESPFEFATFEAVPIRRAQIFSNFLTREFLTAIVRCRLVKKSRNNGKAE